MVALVGVAVWGGYRAGFIATLYGLATWIISFGAAVVFQAQASAILRELGIGPAQARLVAFVAVLVIVESVFSLAGYYALTPIVRALHRTTWPRETDKVLGVLPSVARSLFVTGAWMSHHASRSLPSESIVPVVETVKWMSRRGWFGELG